MFKDRIIKIELLIILILLIFAGFKLWPLVFGNNTWGDSIFERTSSGDYFLIDTDYIKEAYLTQKFEGRAKSIGVSFTDNVQFTTIELESVLNPGKSLNLNIPTEIEVRPNALGIYNTETNLYTADSSNDLGVFVNQISKGDFVSVETLNSMDFKQEPLSVLNFTLIPRK